MVKGTAQKESGAATPSKYVGFTSVEVRAVNPTRSELNKLLGKEDADDDKEINYLTQDQEGNDRVRMSFWLYDAKLDKYFIHSFNLTNKERLSKDGSKNQYINGSALTAWADEEANLQNWFTNFIKDKQEIGKKDYRKALLGEEELATLLRSWLGRISWNDPETSVMLDTAALFNEDYTELRSLIDGDYDTPFVVLTGVKTDENDTNKQYQQIYGKSFLPGSFMNYIQKGAFPTDYSKKAWARFEEEVSGPYGFNSYFEMTPIAEYDKEKDVAASPSTLGVTPSNSKY